MRPLSSPRLIAATLLISSAHIGLATPTDIIPTSQPDERGLADLLGNLGGKAAGGSTGNISDEIGNIIGDVSALIASFVSLIQNSTENDLVELLGVDVKSAKTDDQALTNSTVGAVSANATCPGMAVLFARGTTEPGNMGLYTGPSFVTALRNYINGSTTLAVQGIPYPASIPGFLAGGSPFGSAVMAAMVNKTAAACPNTKIVLSGYSQGAEVVHNAMTLINKPANTTTTTTTTASTSAVAARQAKTTTSSSATATSTASNAGAPISRAAPVSAAQINSKIMSVVLFGDPRNGTAVTGLDAARVQSFCNAQDDICAKGGDIVTLDHLTYNQNAPQAAMFVMQKSGLGLASNDAANQGMANVPTVPASKLQGMSGATQIGQGAGLPGIQGIQSLFRLGRG